MTRRNRILNPADAVGAFAAASPVRISRRSAVELCGHTAWEVAS